MARQCTFHLVREKPAEFPSALYAVAKVRFRKLRRLFLSEDLGVK